MNICVEFPTPNPTRDHRMDVAMIDLPGLPHANDFFELNGFEFVVKAVMWTPQRNYDALVELQV